MIAQAARDTGAFLHEGAAGFEFARLLADPVWRGQDVPHGGGEPVLLVPGFLMPDAGMRTMSVWLRRIGYRPQRAGLGANAGCGEDGVRHLEERAEALAEQHGQRVAVIGHSRGGAFARVLATRRPDLIAGAITLGTPQMTGTRTFHPMLSLSIGALATFGTMRMPSVLRHSCLTGACCERFRAEASLPVHEDVWSLGLIPSRDHVVRDRGWLQLSGQRTTTVDASHGGVIVNAEAYREVASGLQRALRADRRR